MRLLDLFSGIGGFSLAASWVWGEELDIVCFCEQDQFCQKVLKKHWPSVPIVEDVNDVERIVAYSRPEHVPSRRIGVGSIKEAKGEGQTVELGSASSNIDLLTGGFPCQPASCAGKRKGTADSRWLWPQTIRIIREIRPRFCILENVPGLLTIESGVLFETVCSELEDAGYSVQPFIIPAAGVGAPHRRDRVWIVAKSNGNGCGPRRTERQGQNGTSSLEHADCHATDPERYRFQGRVNENSRERAQIIRRRFTDTPVWNEHWHEAATRLCVLSNGLPGGLARPKGWRVNALRAAGNSIVPQVAAQIMQAMKGAGLK